MPSVPRRRVLVINGHPDPDPARFCHGLALAYAEAAKGAGLEAELIMLGMMGIPPLSTRAEWEHGQISPAVEDIQSAITRADHVVVIYPLWLGSMPALLKAMFEQVFRPGFAIDTKAKNPLWPGKLKGKSARVIVTMGMPALLYRWFFLAHSVRSLERNILRFAGLGPVRSTIIGSVEESQTHRQKWMERVREMGSRGE